MKKLLNLFLFLLVFNACNNFHDSIQPADDLPIDAVYQTAADLESALVGVYDAFQSDGLAGLNLVMIPGLLSGNGNFEVGGFPEEIDISNRNMRASNFRAEQTWVAAYYAINLINAILAALPEVEDAALTPAASRRIEGEALFLRGYLYFELARLYGKPYGDTSPEGGVPIVTEPVLQREDLTFPSRASVEATYAKAEDDLAQAKGLLEGAALGADRANALAADALLARLAFQQEDYAKAGAIAQLLIDVVGFNADAPPQAIFQETSNEVLWAVAFSPGDNSAGKVQWFHKNSLRTEISPGLKAAFESVAAPAQKAAIEAEGLRIIDLRVDPGILTSHPLISADTAYTNKYEDIQNFADDTPMARLAEFVLMRAEVLARAGEMEESIQLLNLIRERSLRIVDAAGNEMPDKKLLLLFNAGDFQSAEELIEAIILERRVELCFEGNYLHDMIRLKRDIEGISYDDCRLRLPVPQRELDVNPNLRDDCH
ncbi:MAG: RagB/SusD family nutrient uptake outer membrane protein [Phaeodactylibacter sp.]|nr:RagB/SusD family nutrient uptake outer membrane protein [Phaeodactylibacter sp.]